MKLPISSISVGERQRTDLGDLSDLESMADPSIGLVNPITVRKLPDGQYELVAGNRRLSKARALGWAEIDVVDRGSMTEFEKQQVELIEDIARRDRSWQERVRAIAKLHRMKKTAANGDWTVRKMAAFLNETKSKIGYLLQTADEMGRNPEGPVAKAESYTDAVKALVRQHEDNVRTELERRRQGQASTLGESPEPVLNLDTTAPLAPVSPVDPVIVTLRGTNIAFEKAIPGKDFKAGAFDSAIGYNPPVTVLSNLADALSPHGTAVIWLDDPRLFTTWYEQADSFGFLVQPYPLIWSKVDPKPCKWPFDMNYAIGVVLRKSDQEWDKESKNACTFIVPQEPGELPYHIVDTTLEAISAENSPVLCIAGAPVSTVVVVGRVPVFFEADTTRFDKMVNKLEEYYINSIPDVEVRR